jgi:hypothetical protein
MCEAEILRQWPSFKVDWAEIICQGMATQLNIFK